MQKIIFFILLLFPFWTAVYSQNLDSLLEIQWKADPHEKIHVHFDKEYYNPGETVWFKAYIYNGNTPSISSKNFYAELIDESGKVIRQISAPIIFAGANASFDIDSNFTKPVLFFRGYTVAALNSDTGFLFTKAIPVLLPKQGGIKPQEATSTPKVRFLPEGGDLITGLPSTVAFISTNNGGQPVDITGKITDNTGKEVARLITLHNGMGRVELTPEVGRTYTATWKWEGGKEVTTPLPLPKPEGLSLKVVSEGSNKRFILRHTGGINQVEPVHIVAIMNGQPMFKGDINMSTRTSATGVFPTIDIPSGILQVTAFDQAYKPLAERIVFVNNHDFEFDGDVFLSQKGFGARQLNRVEVTVTDTVPANLSLSIVDADLNEKGRMNDNIVSRLLLTGNLRGKIFNPYYYFFSNIDSAAIHLDLVMLTHGWRRFNWEAVLAGKTPTPLLKESNYLSLKGQLAGMPPGTYSADLQLTGILQTSDSAKTIISLPVDRQGNVSTDGLLFYDKAKLYFSFNKNNLSFDKSMLLIDNGLHKNYPRTTLDSILKKSIPPLPSSVLATNNTITQKLKTTSRQLAQKGVLETVTVTARTKTTKEKMEEKYVSGLFTGDGISFDLVNDPVAGSYMSIFQYLQGRVAGLQITGAGMTPTLTWRGGTPALYLNEMQTDPSMLSSTPVTDIAYIKVLRPGSSVVSGGGGGVIAVYTRKGGDTQPDPNARGLNSVQMTGYSALKEFYSPDYATFSPRDAFEDVRSTLYWNPTLYFDKTMRHLRLQFYNNDITKRFRLVMEGINSEGKLIHVEKEIENVAGF